MFRLEQRQARLCSVCGSDLNEKNTRDRAVVAELFGINIAGWIDQGNCPAAHCLSDECAYPPDEVRRRWARFLKRQEKRKT